MSVGVLTPLERADHTACGNACSRVVNYVQGLSVADVEAFIADPRLQAALTALEGIAQAIDEHTHAARAVGDRPT